MLEARELDRRNVARRECPSLTSGLAAPAVARQAAGLDIVTVGCASTFGLLLFSQTRCTVGARMCCYAGARGVPAIAVSGTAARSG